MVPEDEDQFCKNSTDRYSARPDDLEELCLAEFTANYDVDYSLKNPHTADAEDHDPQQPDETSRLQPRIHLKHDMGVMMKRTREAIIRFHKYNYEKDKENYFRSKIMLYYPWRNEDIDLLGNYPSHQEHYEPIQDDIKHNEGKCCSRVTASKRPTPACMGQPSTRSAAGTARR